MTRIMIIDDDMMLSRALREQLLAQAYDVDSYTSAEESVAAAAANPPDLFMIDVMLPDATGFQVVDRLRKNPKTKSTPIIMMTGTARHPNQMHIGKNIMGADEYLLKPFDMDDVSDKIQKLLKIIPPADVPAVPEPLTIPEVPPVPETLTVPDEAAVPAPEPAQAEERILERPAAMDVEPEFSAPPATTYFPEPELEPQPTQPTVKQAPAAKAIRFPHVRWAAALFLLHMALARNVIEVAAGWGLFLGLLVIVCVAIGISLTAEEAVGMMVWPAIPIVIRAGSALMGLKYAAQTLTPKLYWLRPLDVFELAAILVLGLNLRRLRGGSLLKALAASFLIALGWCLTNRGYFHP